MVKKAKRSVVSLLWVVVLVAIGSGLFGLAAGFFFGKEDLAGEFSTDQIEYVDGLVFGTQIKTEREEWVKQFQNKQVPANDYRAYPGQRCAGKFFPDHPVAMKGCIAALDPRPPEGYQFPS